MSLDKTKYALVRVKTGWYNINSTVGLKLKAFGNIVRVEKKGNLLYWEKGDVEIPPIHISEVINGDISEFMI